MRISSAGVFSRPWWDKSEQRWCSSLAWSVAAADYTTFSSDKQSTQITERTAVLELPAVWRARRRYRIHSPINNCSRCRFDVRLSPEKLTALRIRLLPLSVKISLSQHKEFILSFKTLWLKVSCRLWAVGYLCCFGDQAPDKLSNTSPHCKAPPATIPSLTPQYSSK